MLKRFLVTFLCIPFAGLAAPADLPPKKTATVFGQEIRYYDVGTGPVVVLLHGFASSASGDWGRVIGPLSAAHRVIAPDQLGFGDSAKPNTDFRVQTWVDFLGEFLRQQGITHFTLAGESLGGWIAAQYTIQAEAAAPGTAFALPRPDRLILCDAAGHRTPPRPKGDNPFDTTTLEGCRRLLGLIYHDPSYTSDAFVRGFYSATFSKGDGNTTRSFMNNPAVESEFVDGKLGAISIPTLVIWGEFDVVVPLADGKDYAAKIPAAWMVVIPNAAHAPCIEAAPAFLAEFVPFVDGK